VSGTGTLVVSNNAASTFNGTLQNGAAGTLAVTKAGSGVLTLANVANPYTGATVINDGTLTVSGTAAGLTGTTTVQVNNEAVLNLGTGNDAANPTAYSRPLRLPQRRYS